MWNLFMFGRKERRNNDREKRERMFECLGQPSGQLFAFFTALVQPSGQLFAFCTT
jgi:hypothetical protein